MSDVQERTLYTCEMRGGPQDGGRCAFETLPILLYLTTPYLGFYSLTDTVIEDGARVFEYHAPSPAVAEADMTTEPKTHRIRLTGGPYDGKVSELPVLPELTGMAPVPGDRGPVYARSRTNAMTDDGAHIFEYMPPRWLDRLLRRR